MRVFPGLSSLSVTCFWNRSWDGQFLALSQLWDSLDAASPKASKVAAKLVPKLCRIGHAGDVVLYTRAVQIARSVSESDLIDPGWDGLVQSLISQTYALKYHGDLLQAYNASLEAVVRVRALFRDHPQRHGWLLLYAIHNHMGILDVCAGRLLLLYMSGSRDAWRKPSLSMEQLQLETKGWREEYDKLELYRRSAGLDFTWQPRLRNHNSHM